LKVTGKKIYIYRRTHRTEPAISNGTFGSWSRWGKKTGGLCTRGWPQHDGRIRKSMDAGWTV